jgi:hypothetical protein
MFYYIKTYIPVKNKIQKDFIFSKRDFILSKRDFIFSKRDFILSKRDFIRQLSLEPQGIARPYNITYNIYLQYIITIALRAYNHIQFLTMKIKSLRSFLRLSPLFATLPLTQNFKSSTYKLLLTIKRVRSLNAPAFKGKKKGKYKDHNFSPSTYQTFK